MEFNPIIEILDKITIVFGTITMCGVFYNIWQNRKNRKLENQKIQIIFDVLGIDYLLDLDMPRKHISRSEIQGILAAFQKDISSRYSIEYLSDISFLDDIFLIQQNKIDKLTIKLSKKEFSQFNENKMRQR